MRTGQVAVTPKQCEGENSQETGKQSFMRLLGHLSCSAYHSAGVGPLPLLHSLHTDLILVEAREGY